VAEGGPQALALISQQPCDVVLLDIQMPGMSGLEVLQVLRQTYAPVQLPIIEASEKPCRSGRGGKEVALKEQQVFPSCSTYVLRCLMFA
jgi:CheY-like chemotaxis protein